MTPDGIWNQYRVTRDTAAPTPAPLPASEATDTGNPGVSIPAPEAEHGLVEPMPPTSGHATNRTAQVPPVNEPIARTPHSPAATPVMSDAPLVAESPTGPHADRPAPAIPAGPTVVATPPQSTPAHTAAPTTPVPIAAPDAPPAPAAAASALAAPAPVPVAASTDVDAPAGTEDADEVQATTAAARDVPTSDAATRSTYRALDQAARHILRTLVDVLTGRAGASESQAETMSAADLEETPETAPFASNETADPASFEAASRSSEPAVSPTPAESATPLPPQSIEGLPLDGQSAADAAGNEIVLEHGTSASRAEAPSAPPAAGRPAPFAAPSRAAISWLNTVLQQPAAFHTDANGTDVLRLRIDEESGAVTLRTRRDGERMVVSVGFTDAALHANAEAQGDDIRAALQQLFDAAVDLSFSRPDQSGHESADPKRAGPGAPGTRGMTESAIETGDPARPAIYHGLHGARHEWVG